MKADRTKLISLAGVMILLVAVAGLVDWSFVLTLQPLVIVEWARPLAIGGATSLAITLCAVVLGLGAGILIAVAMWLPTGRIVRFVLNAYIEIGRNVPLIVLLFWIHFVLPRLTGISTPAFVSGFVALAFQSSAYLADITRGGVQAVDRGQWLAAEALGLPSRWTWGAVILPQALRIMLPAIASLSVSFLNASALLSLLGVAELMSVSTKVSDYAMRPIEIMTFTALLYLCCNLLVTGLFDWLERKFPGGVHAA
jgi:polar amino acid transport system permease protein